jgi:hypothetical protein
MSTYITLKSCPAVHIFLSNFKFALAAFNVEIVRLSENSMANTIEIITNANDLRTCRHVKQASYAFFDDAVISFSLELSQT